MRWPKYWSFSFSIIPSKEIPGLISFRMDWLDAGTVQSESESERKPEVPASPRDEALAHDGVSREVPCSALKGETAT